MKKAIVFGLALAACISMAFVKPADGTRQLTVVIDAAHGGKDFGTTHSGITEKKIVESIAAKIAAANSDADLRIVFTRTDDTFVDLQQRVTIANDFKPDMVVSLHVDSSPNADTSGLEILVPGTSHKVKSTDFAGKFVTEMVSKGHFAGADVEVGNLFLLKNTAAPIIVAELGYLSNEHDRNYLTSQKGQDEIARAVLESLQSLK